MNTSTEQIPTPERMEELSRVILAYSEVTDRLQQSHERLEETVLRLSEELSEKNRLLERRNRLAALGEMAAGIAHEIRNPLGAIQLYASLLAKDVASEPGQLDLVNKIAGGVRRLESLVSHVLQFTRQMQPRPIEADLALIVDEAVALAAPQIEAGGIRVVIEGPRPLPVSVDPLLMSQVLLNLVLNAIEAAGRGGMVRITSGPPRPQGTETRFFIVVEDSGPGIAPQIMDRIFNPFFTTRDNGTGLGLAIVHRVVESHDGSVTACNRDEGGARFEIRV